MEKEKYQKELYELSICCTGISFRFPGGAVSEYQKQSGHEMQYQFNNGVVAFVDKYGDTYILPNTSEIRAKLFLAGYKEGIVNVPMSNGEDVVNDDRFKKDWESIKNKNNPNRVREKYLEELAEYDIRSISQKKGIKPLPENVYEFSINVDSLEYIDVDGKEHESPKSELEYDSIMKTANTGTYNISNGMIVFVDEAGKTFFAPLNSYIENQIKKCGYQKDSSLSVPFSNGEKIVHNDVVSKKLDRLKVISKRFNEGKEYEDLYIQLCGPYEELTISSRDLSEKIRNEGYLLKASERMKNKAGRELQRLKTLHEEISSILSSKKLISPKELKAVVSKYGTLTKDGFVLHEEKDNEEFFEPEEVKTEVEETLVDEVPTNITEREKIIRQQLQEIADRNLIKKIGPALNSWLIDIEGLVDNRGNHYTSYLKYDGLTRENNIGTYCTNNGVAVIIDIDGKTYVAPQNSKVINTLVLSNFRKKDMSVPFSNGEVIANNDQLRAKFEKLREITRRKLETEKFASNTTIDRLEEKYIEISPLYTKKAEEVEQKEAELKFQKHGVKANYSKVNKRGDECRKYSYMIEDLLHQCKKKIAMSTKKVEERMNSHDLSSEEEMSL